MLWHSGLRIWHCLCSGLGHWLGMGLIPSLSQWVKDPALLKLWCSLQLQLRIDTWSAISKKKKKKKKKKRRELQIVICALMIIRFLSWGMNDLSAMEWSVWSRGDRTRGAKTYILLCAVNLRGQRTYCV